MSNLTPVESYGGSKIIGHWNEDINKFIPIDENTMQELLEYYTYPGRPIIGLYLSIRIMDKKREGSYQTYVTYDTGKEDPRMIIKDGIIQL